MKAYMKRAYSYYCTHSKQMDAAVSEYSRRTLEVSLRDSAVARLLVEGKLPSEPCSQLQLGPSGNIAEDPVDLSSKGRLQAALVNLPVGAMASPPSTPAASKSVLSPPPNGVKIDGHEPTVEVLQRSIRREMDKLREARSEVAGEWKCRYCPYTAPTSKTLYSHYQFHQQLLASQSSRAHLEWLSAYRRAKESGLDGDGDRLLSFSYPPHPCPSYGLMNHGRTSSASGFLKAIVKAVMQNKTTGQTTTSIYSNLVNNPSSDSEDSLSTSTRSPTPEKGGRNKKRKLEPHSASPVAKDAKVLDERETKPLLDTSVYFQQDNLSPNREESSEEPTMSLTTGQIEQQAFMEAALVLQSDILSSPVKHVFSSLSPTKTSYLDNLPPRKRSMEAFYDKRSYEMRPALDDCASHQGGNNIASDEISSKLAFIDTTDRTLAEISPNTLADTNSSSNEAEPETIGNNCQSTFVARLDEETAHSPDSVCSEIDVGTDDYAGKTESCMMSQAIMTSQVSQEPCTSEDSGHVTSPLYRPRSTDSVSSLASTSSTRSVTSQWNEEGECVVEMDGMVSHRGVQCEILLAASLPSAPDRLHSSSSSTSANSSSSDSEGESTGRAKSRRKRRTIKCFHCGISFEDEVLHSIHMGCHNHTDPYNCNVCGQSCGNRYGFYTHIMRGHLPV